MGVSRVIAVGFMLFTTVFTASAYAEKAIFAGGCFWCIESDFQDVEGVTAAVSGYTGGHVKDPTYRQVSYSDTGHYEAVEITYDPAVITYKQLLDIYWVNVDPFDAKGQFCDKGDSYRTAIFTLGDEQTRLAERSKVTRQAMFSDETIVTPIIDASVFYPAEDYHQDYYEVNPVRYKYYRWNCGRDARLNEVWGD